MQSLDEHDVIGTRIAGRSGLRCLWPIRVRITDERGGIGGFWLTIRLGHAEGVTSDSVAWSFAAIEIAFRFFQRWRKCPA